MEQNLTMLVVHRRIEQKQRSFENVLMSVLSYRSLVGDLVGGFFSKTCLYLVNTRIIIESLWYRS